MLAQWAFAKTPGNHGEVDLYCKHKCSLQNKVQLSCAVPLSSGFLSGWNLYRPTAQK